MVQETVALADSVLTAIENGDVVSAEATYTNLPEEEQLRLVQGLTDRGSAPLLAMVTHGACSFLSSKRRRRRGEVEPVVDEADLWRSFVASVLSATPQNIKEAAVSESLLLACRCACEATQTLIEQLMEYITDETLSTKRDAGGNTALLLVAQQVHPATLRLLLSRCGPSAGLISTHRNDQGASALHKLFSDPRKCARSNADALAECTELLLAASDRTAMLLAANKHGNTALHKAMRQGQAHACAVLVTAMKTAGVSFATQNSNGESCLHVAAMQGKADLLVMLLEAAGDEARSLVSQTDLGGNSAIHFVAEGAPQETAQGSGTHPFSMSMPGLAFAAFGKGSGREDCLQALISHGADVNQANNLGRTALYLNNHGVEITRALLASGGDAEAADGEGDTPLLRAARNRRLDLVCCLLERLDGKLSDSQLQEVLSARSGHDSVAHAAARSEEYGGRLIELISPTKLPEVTLDLLNADGDTALHVACKWNNLPIVESLVGVASLPHLLEGERSCIQIACDEFSVDALVVLLDRVKALGDGSVPEGTQETVRQCASSEGMSLLHRAAQVGHLDAIKLLTSSLGMSGLQVYQSVDGFEDDGSPLHLACRGGHADVVRWLLATYEGQVDVNCTKNFQRLTPLHLACGAAAPDCVGLLLGVPGIDVSVRAKNGATAADLAREESASQCLALLQAHTSAQ